MKRFTLLFAISFLGVMAAGQARSQGLPDNETVPGFGRGQGAGRGMGQGRGMGRGFGRGAGRGQGAGRGIGAEQPSEDNGAASGPDEATAGMHGHDDRHNADRDVFQYLLQNHLKITRTVNELPNGVETLTESEVPEIADKIKEHVQWMEYRIDNVNPIRMRDPLFAEIFQHADKIKMVHKETENGVNVIETSDDPYVAKLIQAHAKVVSGFVAHGFPEAMKNHPVPSGGSANEPVRTVEKKDSLDSVIAGHGAIAKLPNAVMQPRDRTRFVVDLTGGGDPAKLNGSLKNVARYLNIYADAGAKSANAEVAVVFHGGATRVVLNSEAYAKVFGTTGNPNLELLHQLHEAGVDLYVCGQSLTASGSSPEDVAVFIETAVSALTAVVNLQADGYAYVPLGK
ncbi:DsrE family protein [Neorhodopirellula lusitana]|uniref:DsrE family protein n=1 Tax=Neorhodopirellula lusitana TaxID=445327 RepID=UPI00384C7BDE